MTGRIITLAAALSAALALATPVFAQAPAAPTAAPATAAHAVHKVFATPEEGAAALAAAVRAMDPEALVAVVGPSSKELDLLRRQGRRPRPLEEVPGSV